MLFIFNLRKQGEVGVTVQERFEYDSQNRLVKHYHQVDNNPEELLAENTYNDLSQLVNKKVGNNLQSIDYDYNIRGWMTEINKNQMAATDLGGKLFSYKIKYTSREGIENPDTAQFSGKNVVPKYNGNITEVDWRAVESIGANPSTAPKRYGYAYDKINRLTAGFYQNPQNPNSKENTESLAYDLNGNITSLYRTSVLEYGNTTPTMIDNLQYIYASGNVSNRLTNINDHAQNATGYEGGGQTIGYDVNGNMISMPDKGISVIKYNHLNLPHHLEYSRDGIEMVKLDTKYRADGTKLRKVNTTTISGINGYTTSVKTIDYLDGFQYQNITNSGGGGGGSSSFSASNLESSRAMETQAFSLVDIGGLEPVGMLKNSELQFLPTSEGFYDYIKNQYIYQYKDHLGNTRVSFGKNSAGALEIVDANDYYPFGMNHLKSGNSFFGSSSYKNYKYQGQELQETGFYSFKWRNYMPDVGRFFNIDPLSEKYAYQSHYNFSENRVIDARELEGLEAILLKDTEHNKPIIKTANNGQYADNPNTKTVHVFAHGNPQEFYDEYGKKGQTTINSGALLNGVLNRSSDLWKNSESKEGFTVVLHSCRTGRTTVDKNGNLTESIAEKISSSKEMKGVTIIAPDERDFVTANGKEIGPQSAKNTDNNGEYLPKTPRSEHGKSTGQFGSWNSFKNGEQTNQQPGNTKPSGQDQRSLWDKIFN